MKLNMSKEWFEERIKIEGSGEIGAGNPNFSEELGVNKDMKLENLTQINGKFTPIKDNSAENEEIVDKTPEVKENKEVKLSNCSHLFGIPDSNGLITCKLCGKTKHPAE